jgi:hypothetical protein
LMIAGFHSYPVGEHPSFSLFPQAGRVLLQKLGCSRCYVTAGSKIKKSLKL